jgi:hypothetical protein
VKVNALADAGVAPLVEALSEFPDVQTFESCQGGEGDTPWSEVLFQRGPDWRGNGVFLEWLSAQVGRRRPDLIQWRLTLEWANGGTAAVSRCSVAPEQLETLADEVRELARAHRLVLQDLIAASEADHLAALSRLGLPAIPRPEDKFDLLLGVWAPAPGMRRVAHFNVLAHALALATRSLINRVLDLLLKRHPDSLQNVGPSSDSRSAYS